MSEENIVNNENSENMEQKEDSNVESEQKDESVESQTEENPESGEEGTDDNAENSGDDSEDDELPLPEPDIDQSEAEKKKKHIPEWMKKKIEREKRKEAEALAQREAEAERLRQENERLRSGNANQPQQPMLDPYMPQRDQFNNESEYFMALQDYREEKRAIAHMQHQQQQKNVERNKNYQDGLKDTIESGRSKYSNFDEVTDYILYGDGFPSNHDMGEAIVDSEYKDDILYFLGSNVKEAERIANLTSAQAVGKEIAKIEMRFAAKKRSKLTKAPKALTPVGGGSKGTAVAGDPGKMAPGDFNQWYADKYGN